MVGTKKKHSPNGGLMVINPMVESVEHHLKQIRDDMMHTSNRFGPNTPPSVSTSLYLQYIYNIVWVVPLPHLDVPLEVRIKG